MEPDREAEVTVMDVAVAAWFDEHYREGLAPDTAMTVSEWADAYRILPPTSAQPGRWKTSRTPFAREIMDCLSPGSGYETVVVQACAQVSKSEICLNFLGSIIQLWFGLTLFVTTTTEAARRFVRQRTDAMIEATPELAERVVKPGQRKAGNSALFKSFGGGSVTFVGSNSGAGLRSTPAKFVILDEVDGFPFGAGRDGDPVELAVARTFTFRGQRKILMTSTPTVEGLSRINRAFKEGDQRRLHFGCLHCATRFVPEWKDVRWNRGAPEKAWLQCPICGGVHEEADKPRLLAEAEWRPTAVAKVPGTASFAITGIASPWRSWGEMAVSFLAAKDNPELLQVWTNTQLGECWEDRDATPVEAQTIQARAVACDVPWTEALPDGVVAITCGVDVQNDRLEASFYGWGVNEQAWSLDHRIIPGDTSAPEPWRLLDQLILRRFRHCRAVDDLPVLAVAVDSGHRIDHVATFCAPRQSRRVWMIKGKGGPQIPVWPRLPPKIRKGKTAPLFVVGVDAAKRTIMDRLRDPGRYHFADDLDTEFFLQLTSERPVRMVKAGRPRIEWVRDPGIRNEVLDCAVYAFAALHGCYTLGLNLDAEHRRIAAAPMRAVMPTDTPPPPAPSVKVARSKFLAG